MAKQASSGGKGVRTVEFSQVIDRPISDVFHFVAEQHVQNHPRWDPDIELELETPGPIGVGTLIRRRNTRYDVPVEGTMEVVEYEQNESIGTVIKEGGFEMSGRIVFEALGPSKTMLTRSATLPDSIDPELIHEKMEQSGHRIEELLESAL
ncbi:SRPBCC family protein [Haloferax sp. YSMS24]|uniref:SRPBCC family protein n=1 Tax=unclassified Haloferax TaxID=2625095 RepID=UPI00398CB1D2